MGQALFVAILPLILVAMGYTISNRFTRLERRITFLEERVKMLEEERSRETPQKSSIRSLRDS